jgi:hypothetical protein
MNAHFRRVGWIVFWAAALVLALLVVPVMQNSGAIPAVVFAIIVLALASVLWGGGTFGRKTVVLGATLVLVLMLFSFFLPRTAKRAPGVLASLDAKLATARSLEDIVPFSKTGSLAQHAAPAPVVEEEALVLECECWTPCSTKVEWPFKVIWGDNPLKITYPGGVAVERRGQDQDFQAPNFWSGEVKFASLDPDHLHFRVQVYRVTVG